MVTRCHSWSLASVYFIINTIVRVNVTKEAVRAIPAAVFAVINFKAKMAEQASIELLKAENYRLRRTLLIVVSERKKMVSQITGVRNLGVQLQKKEQELRTLSGEKERLQSYLARAENRITHLSPLAGNSRQTVAGQGAIVTPGVSKKLLEALTRENIELRSALDNITNRGPSGVDLAMVSITVSLGNVC